jgi:ATP-dependent 26S proteasome regulatory subunit
VQEDGRLQILNIHTRKMKANGKLADDVDLAELAQITKVKESVFARANPMLWIT